MTRASLAAAVVLTAIAAGLMAWDAPHGLSRRLGAEGTQVLAGFWQPASTEAGELIVETTGAFRLAIDGQLILAGGAAESALPVVPVAGTRDARYIELSFESDAEPRLKWMAASAHVPSRIADAAFSPVTLTRTSWQLRDVRRWVGGAAAWAWAWCLMWGAWRGVVRLLPGAAPATDRPMQMVLLSTGALGLVGIWWGWPVTPWAPDELWPSSVLNGLSRHFSSGWFDLYPPGHFYVLSGVFAPALVLKATGLWPLGAEGMDAALHLLSRGVSLAMAVGLVVLVARLAEQLGGRAYAWPTALCATASLPFVFYSRLANLDVPYLFWFCVSLVFFRAAVEDARPRDVLGFAVTGMFAVITKDQAYGLYVAPAAWLAWRLLRSPGGARTLAMAAIGATLTFVAGHNLVFNLSGFREHVASITGGGSETYRMVPASMNGLMSLVGIVGGQLWFALGVPGVALAAAGVWQQRRHAWMPRWLWLFSLSYLLTFVAVVGYSYDRFLLPVTLVLGLLGGAGLRGLLDAGKNLRGGRVVAGACVLWLVWRMASVDVLQVRDSRYAAEEWLRTAVPRGALVASIWQAGYQPRLEAYRHREIAPTVEATLDAGPEFVVVNTEFINRYPADAAQSRWFLWLASPGSPYVEVWRWKDPLRWTELAWWPTFVDRRESVSSNLDKANPEIVIFRRK